MLEFLKFIQKSDITEDNFFLLENKNEIKEMLKIYVTITRQMIQKSCNFTKIYANNYNFKIGIIINFIPDEINFLHTIFIII